MTDTLTLKILMIGESGVGKTSIVKRYCEGVFEDSMMSTVGIDFEFKETTVGGKKIKLQISGQERFHNVTSSYFRGTHGCVIVYDVNKVETYDRLSYWVEEYLDEQPNSEIVIVGNKADNGKQVSKDVTQDFAYGKKVKRFYTSAKTGMNIDEVFDELAEAISSNEKIMSSLHETNKITTLAPIEESKSCC
ncbi:hypothetical protein EIN_284900 [Entamoeba invadens IP1]|uniref:Uncharacterized protein n=1 Tax=Entamoeba invadens IP1 TaxID=370355 RepID=L7FKS2_ENTIV|nr:hypothetical protein EIN_284900 [Entamoeba invadens IP1]ELP84904.1 hypothetical protein EIN_284900 [Entamoeba invadens IP1]|eukprot:XP_004184250.1 hypothetical protein EIN_284900 [Entamoeba invadens IP1]